MRAVQDSGAAGQGLRSMVGAVALALVVLALGGCTDSVWTTPDGGAVDGAVPDDFGASGDLAEESCATQSQAGTLVPLDILLALDTSFSMDFAGKWVSVRAALKSFIHSPSVTGLGLGLQYFPLRAQCSVAAYSTPAVAMATLPGVTAAIESSLDAQQMSGGTPMVQVLEGALAYARDWQTQNPARKTVIVLATDGIPDQSCSVDTGAGRTNSIANAVAVATESSTGAPAIPVFVVGVGSDLTPLDQIAQAGGSGSAILVDTGGNVEAAFLGALNAIRGQALACDYAVPTSSSGVIDFDRVNVNFTAGAAPPRTLINVGSAAGCGNAPGEGWYYDDPASPTRIVLCADACSVVSSTPNARVDVVFGCQTRIL